MAIILVLSALGVVICRSPVYSALCLIANLSTMAGLFASLDAHFLAAAQIIVYAGAIMVLFLFVIMLLNLKIEHSHSSVLFNAFSWIGGIILAVVLGKVMLHGIQTSSGAPLEFNSSPQGIGGVEEIGKLLFTDYIFPFETSSLLLIAAIVGAVMLGKRSYKSGDSLPPGKPVER